MLSFRNSMTLIAAAALAVAIGMLVHVQHTSNPSANTALVAVGSPIADLTGVCGQGAACVLVPPRFDLRRRTRQDQSRRFLAPGKAGPEARASLRMLWPVTFSQREKGKRRIDLVPVDLPDQ